MYTENRKVVVIEKETGIYTRTVRSLANRLVEAGTHNFTSKGSLKKFLNREAKLHRNHKYIKRFRGMEEPKSVMGARGRIYKEIGNFITEYREKRDSDGEVVETKVIHHITGPRRVIYSYANS